MPRDVANHPESDSDDGSSGRESDLSIASSDVDEFLQTGSSIAKKRKSRKVRGDESSGLGRSSGPGRSSGAGGDISLTRGQTDPWTVRPSGPLPSSGNTRSGIGARSKKYRPGSTESESDDSEYEGGEIVNRRGPGRKAWTQGRYGSGSKKGRSRKPRDFSDDDSDYSPSSERQRASSESLARRRRGEKPVDSRGKSSGSRGKQSSSRGKPSGPRGKLAEQAATLVGQANNLYIKRDLEGAIELLHEAARLSHGQSSIFQTLADIYSEQGNDEKTLDCILVAAHFSKTDTDLWLRVNAAAEKVKNERLVIKSLYKARRCEVSAYYVIPELVSSSLGFLFKRKTAALFTEKGRSIVQRLVDRLADKGSFLAAAFLLAPLMLEPKDDGDEDTDQHGEIDQTDQTFGETDQAGEASSSNSSSEESQQETHKARHPSRRSQSTSLSTSSVGVFSHVLDSPVAKSVARLLYLSGRSSQSLAVLKYLISSVPGQVDASVVNMTGELLIDMREYAQCYALLEWILDLQDLANNPVELVGLLAICTCRSESQVLKDVCGKACAFLASSRVNPGQYCDILLKVVEHLTDSDNVDLSSAMCDKLLSFLRQSGRYDSKKRNPNGYALDLDMDVPMDVDAHLDVEASSEAQASSRRAQASSEPQIDQIKARTVLSKFFLHSSKPEVVVELLHAFKHTSPETASIVSEALRMLGQHEEADDLLFQAVSQYRSAQSKQPRIELAESRESAESRDSAEGRESTVGDQGEDFESPRDSREPRPMEHGSTSRSGGLEVGYRAPRRPLSSRALSKPPLATSHSSRVAVIQRLCNLLQSHDLLSSEPRDAVSSDKLSGSFSTQFFRLMWDCELDYDRVEYERSLKGGMSSREARSQLTLVPIEPSFLQRETSGTSSSAGSNARWEAHGPASLGNTDSFCAGMSFVDFIKQGCLVCKKVGRTYEACGLLESIISNRRKSLSKPEIRTLEDFMFELAVGGGHGGISLKRLREGIWSSLNSVKTSDSAPQSESASDEVELALRHESIVKATSMLASSLFGRVSHEGHERLVHERLVIETRSWLMRVMTRYPKSAPLVLLAAHFWTYSGSMGLAASEYEIALNLFRESSKIGTSSKIGASTNSGALTPDLASSPYLVSPYLFLRTAVALQCLAANRRIESPDLVVIKASKFLTVYKQKRLAQQATASADPLVQLYLQLETQYNLARFFHQLKMVDYAVARYLEILTSIDQLEARSPESLLGTSGVSRGLSDIRRLAAFNLASVFSSCANVSQAKSITRRYMTVRIS